MPSSTLAPVLSMITQLYLSVKAQLHRPLLQEAFLLRPRQPVISPSLTLTAPATYSVQFGADSGIGTQLLHK